MLIYKLAGQMVAHLRGYLKDDDEVRNVLLYYQAPRWSSLIHGRNAGAFQGGGHPSSRLLSTERMTFFEAVMA